MNMLTALLAGLLFGIGLLLSGMTDPSRVIGFLDLAGLWNPSLAFVMGGAVLVGLFAFRFAQRRSTTYLGSAIYLPSAQHIDRRLVLGNVSFGVGWGLAGFCPGPALVALAAGQQKALVFTVAMLGGMLLYELADKLVHAPAGKA